MHMRKPICTPGGEHLIRVVRFRDWYQPNPSALRPRLLRCDAGVDAAWPPIYEVLVDLWVHMSDRASLEHVLRHLLTDGELAAAPATPMFFLRHSCSLLA
jgi:hypothetical protein